jgi:hypothetical protein
MTLRTISKPITWKSVLFTFGVGGIVLTYFLIEKKRKDESKHDTFHESFLISYLSEIKEELTKSAGQARIGGPFTLVDHNGNPGTNIIDIMAPIPMIQLHLLHIKENFFSFTLDSPSVPTFVLQS